MALRPPAAWAGGYDGSPVAPAVASGVAPAVATAATRHPAWAAPAGAVAVHAAVGWAVAARSDHVPGWEAATAVVAPAVPAAVAAAWWSGRRDGERERVARREHEERITGWTGEAVRDAWAERSRVTAGLEKTVSARTTGMVREAEAGRLAETAERAREALGAMRVLLDRQGGTTAYAERRPQPTPRALNLRVRQSRAAGRSA